MNSKKEDFVWIFAGAGGRFASGAFTAVEIAEAWIAKHSLTGVLTRYPLDQGAYDWAISSLLFEAKKEHESSPQFIQRFTSASQEHYHFEDGHRC